MASFWLAWCTIALLSSLTTPASVNNKDNDKGNSINNKKTENLLKGVWEILQGMADTVESLGIKKKMDDAPKTAPPIHTSLHLSSTPSPFPAKTWYYITDIQRWVKKIDKFFLRKINHGSVDSSKKSGSLSSKYEMPSQSHREVESEPCGESTTIKCYVAFKLNLTSPENICTALNEMRMCLRSHDKDCRGLTRLDMALEIVQGGFEENGVCAKQDLEGSDKEETCVRTKCTNCVRRYADDVTQKDGDTCDVIESLRHCLHHRALQCGSVLGRKLYIGLQIWQHAYRKIGICASAEE